MIKHKHTSQSIHRLQMVRTALIGVFLLTIVATLMFAASVYAANSSTTEQSNSKQAYNARVKAEQKRKAEAKKRAVAAQKEKERKKKAALKAEKQRIQKLAKANSAVGSTPNHQRLSGALYVDAALKRQGRPELIASQPVGAWFGGWNSDIRSDIDSVVTKASLASSIPTLVAYNIPSRDCGSYSAGGANSSDSYRSWIRQFANGVGSRKAIVIIEPDALAGMDCLNKSDQQQRLNDLSYAVETLSKTGAYTYLDAGNYTWHSASTMVSRLASANIAKARGFSLNVSGYGWTKNTIQYGQQISIMTKGKPFVIDTSRNGRGPAPNNEWCNPRGRGLGERPSLNTGVGNLDAYLWIKVPGESDGTCNGGPSAGQWWNDIARELIANMK